MFFNLSKKPKLLSMDTAASTPVADLVLQNMLPYFSDHSGNSSSIHSEGLLAKTALTESRNQVSRELGALSDEIIFTAGGSEGNALAIAGAALAFYAKFGHGGRIITFATEHRSVLQTFQSLDQTIFEVIVLPVNTDGSYDLKILREAITSDTILVSVSYANNEIGTIAPLADIAKIIRRARKVFKSSYPLFHTDACQAPRFLPLGVPVLGVDLMTLNGSKIYGPKGVGALYKKRGVDIRPLVYGGGQESGLRAGTENIPGIVGFASALSLCSKNREEESSSLFGLREYFFQEIKKYIPNIVIHGSTYNRLPNNINITIPKVEAEWLVIQLDAQGILVSTGSACSSANMDDKHVLKALYGANVPIEGSVRITLDREATVADIDRLVKAIVSIERKQV